MIGLNVNLDGDGAWPELRDVAYVAGEATHVAVMPNGTGKGKPAILIRGKLEDGTDVVLQTTWNLLYTATRAITARYGEAS